MFKVVWDTKYNGVRLTMSAAGEALNVSPRPVFWEELDLLGLNKMGWIYPHVDEPLLWACDRRYFFKGQFVLEVKGGNIFDAPTVIPQNGFESLTLSPVNMEKLRERNEDTMFIIEHEAMVLSIKHIVVTRIFVKWQRRILTLIFNRLQLIWEKRQSKNML